MDREQHAIVRKKQFDQAREIADLQSQAERDEAERDYQQRVMKAERLANNRRNQRPGPGMARGYGSVPGEEMDGPYYEEELPQPAMEAHAREAVPFEGHF